MVAARAGPCCTDGACKRDDANFAWVYAIGFMRLGLCDPDIVRASEFSIRFKAAAAMATSVASVSSVRDRRASPITRLYRPIAASTLARRLEPLAFCQPLRPSSP